MVSSKKQTNSVIDNSKNFQVITHSLYLVANPKTGKIEQPTLRFGGYYLEDFYFNEETKRTEIRQGFHNREPLLVIGDNFPVLTSTIYLNELFLYRQLGLRHYYEEKARFEKHFDFKALIQVLAHEIIHVILTDFYPGEEEHGELHKKLVIEMVKTIEASAEYEELKKFWK
ncbi:13258_t:CDS:2 [Funneliformis geosporum]|uniref:13258_t:CDS:1 n=1 Tax=Funneliformis geosporum TaxID=1117311 RepID=A0A9W4T8M2_9GLOM|nr:13258_t:CDS:2 [Funneliformis geosporum]